jgi:hypothetical protein
VSTLALAESIRDLLPGGLSVHIGEAPATSPTLPWVVLRVTVPRVDDRSEGSSELSRLVRVQATVAGATEDSVLIIADQVIGALDAAQPIAEGWSTGRLLMTGDVAYYSDDVRVANTNTHVQVAALRFNLTASRIA